MKKKINVISAAFRPKLVKFWERIGDSSLFTNLFSICRCLLIVSYRIYSHLSHDVVVKPYENRQFSGPTFREEGPQTLDVRFQICSLPNMWQSFVEFRSETSEEDVRKKESEQSVASWPFMHMHERP